MSVSVISSTLEADRQTFDEPCTSWRMKNKTGGEYVPRSMPGKSSLLSPRFKFAVNTADICEGIYPLESYFGRKVSATMFGGMTKI